MFTSLKGKKGLIVGIANEKSIAWGVAKAFSNMGADLALTYFNEKAKKYVQPLAEEVNAEILLPLDVTVPGQLEEVFEEIKIESKINNQAKSQKDDQSKNDHSTKINTNIPKPDTNTIKPVSLNSLEMKKKIQNNPKEAQPQRVNELKNVLNSIIQAQKGAQKIPQKDSQEMPKKDNHKHIDNNNTFEIKKEEIKPVKLEENKTKEISEEELRKILKVD